MPTPDKPLRVISLGAGVQSTAMALMAAHGEIGPMPDCAIFADTGSEPRAVYDHLAWLMSPNVLPFPVHVVSAGNLGEEIMRSARGEDKRGSHARPPFHVKNVAANGSFTDGMVRRQCTGDFKLDPIKREVKRLLGLPARGRWPSVPVVEQWIGISKDEAIRMKPSRLDAILCRWPLIELELTRWGCLRWMEVHGYPKPPKSSCTFCPYHSNEQWRHLRDTDAAGWQHAVDLDAAIRHGLAGPGLKGELYVHRDLVPLDQADLSTDAERGQADLFGNECEGICGV